MNGSKAIAYAFLLCLVGMFASYVGVDDFVDGIGILLIIAGLVLGFVGYLQPD